MIRRKERSGIAAVNMIAFPLFCQPLLPCTFYLVVQNRQRFGKPPLSFLNLQPFASHAMTYCPCTGILFHILESMSVISVVSVIHWHRVIVLKLTRALTGERSASVGCDTEIPGFTAHLGCCTPLDICVKTLMSHQSAALSVCCYTFCV